ncbi:hypothetical protein ACTFIZ_004187 [Dictyostelium cf. discoideum]
MDYFREKRILNGIYTLLSSYPFYLLSSIEKTRNGIGFSNSIEIINEIKNEKGIIGFYKGIGTLIILSPIYFLTKLILNYLISKLFKNIKTIYKNKNENENEIEIENKLKLIISLFYQYPKMFLKDCLILSPFKYNSFKIINDIIFRDNGDLNIKSAIIILIKFLPIFILRRILNLITTGRNIKPNLFTGYSFSNLFYSSISIIPILILKHLIITIGLNQINTKINKIINKIINNNNNQNNELLLKFKNIYFNSITQGILITILINPLEVIRLQYIHQFISSYVEKYLDSQSQQYSSGSGILPIVIDPISMAIKISKEKGITHLLFSGFISFSIFNILNKISNKNNN